MPGPRGGECASPLRGPGVLMLGLASSEGLGRNARKALGIDTILDLVGTHVKEDKPVVFVFVFGVEAKSTLVAYPG